MHISSSSGRKKARIEIIPLIDIMFFLLAAFMLVSLNLATAKSVKVNLPIAQTGQPESKPNTAAISIQSTGAIFLDKQPIGRHELTSELRRRRGLQPELRVIIAGDTDTHHGAVIGALDAVRSAGIQTVAFSTRPTDAQH